MGVIFSGCIVAMEDCQLLEPKGDSLQEARTRGKPFFNNKNTIKSVVQLDDNKFKAGGQH